MKLFFVSLGCDKNLVDSEVMLGYLREKNYEITNDETEADVVVVNTCCFIHDAKEESINTILEMAEYKKCGSLKALIVAGCLAQRYHAEIREEIPEVDAIIGTTGYEAICDAIEKALQGHFSENLKDVNYLPKNDTIRVNTTGGYYAYLKIAEGCDKHCTYCVIPSIRGKFRSVPMEKLLEEASYLALNGAKELILVAQETTLYGVDLYGEKRLPALLTELCKISGLEWIRILYCYPEEITDGPLICSAKASISASRGVTSNVTVEYARFKPCVCKRDFEVSEPVANTSTFCKIVQVTKLRLPPAPSKSNVPMTST